MRPPKGQRPYNYRGESPTYRLTFAVIIHTAQRSISQIPVLLTLTGCFLIQALPSSAAENDVRSRGDHNDLEILRFRRIHVDRRFEETGLSDTVESAASGSHRQ